jgi:lipopolysaccharide/colanic/teichoic acid biosynthesis glycosyltransferase
MNPPTAIADRPLDAANQSSSGQGHSSASSLSQAQGLVSGVDPKRLFFRRKYVFSRVLGSILLVVTAPIILLLCGIVRLTSKGPGLYRQRRVGLSGTTFHIVKIRTMVVDSEPSGKPVWCVKGDPRITCFGRFLRKTHLDELPQLWNVARGDMCLIGPRPERPEICDKLAGMIEGYYDRNTIKPGVTGLSQINLPADECFEDVQRKQILDLRYIEEANSWLEIRILMATALRLLGLRGSKVMKVMRLCRRELLSAETIVPAEDEPSFAYSGPSRPR